MTLSRNGKAIRILTRDTNSGPPLNATKLIGSSGARLQLEAAAKKRGAAARFGKPGLNATGPILKPQNVIDLMEGLFARPRSMTGPAGTHCSALASSEGLRRPGGHRTAHQTLRNVQIKFQNCIGCQEGFPQHLSVC